MPPIGPNDGRSLARLATAPSSWRILNLGREAALRDPGAALFFRRRLNAAIFVKHTLRPNERDLFDDPPAVATKLMLPVDPGAGTAGMFAVFVGERGWRTTLLRLAGVDVDNPRSPADRTDKAVLASLDATPTLDELVLPIELRPHLGPGVDAVFPTSLTDDHEARAFAIQETAPLVRLAVGSATHSKAASFVDAVFGPTLDPKALDFFGTLGIPGDAATPIAQAWKAALAFEPRVAEIRVRLAAFARDIAGLGFVGSTPEAAAQGREGKAKLIRIAQRRARDLAEAASRFDRRERAEVLRAGSTHALSDYLSAMPSAIRVFARAKARAETLLSFWRFAAAPYPAGVMPADAFADFADAAVRFERQFDAAARRSAQFSIAA